MSEPFHLHVLPGMPATREGSEMLRRERIKAAALEWMRRTIGAYRATWKHAIIQPIEATSGVDR